MRAVFVQVSARYPTHLHRTAQGMLSHDLHVYLPEIETRLIDLLQPPMLFGFLLRVTVANGVNVVW